MLRKMLIGLMSFIVAMGTFLLTVQAEDLQEGDYKYQILEGGTAEITDYTGADIEVVIPGALGGHQVTSIGEYAFYACYDIQSVIIPEGVLKLGEYSFSECGALTDIKIPDSVTSIEYMSFDGCDSLTAIMIPKGVVSIGEQVFSNCRSLEYIDVSEENIFYSSVDGVLLNKDKTKIVLYPRNKTGDVYTTPETVTTIGRNSFVVISNLCEIIFSDNVKTVEAYAFESCDKLSKIVLSDATNHISGNSFYLCRSLSVIEVSDNNTYLESVDGVLFNEDKTTLIKYPSGMDVETYSIPGSVVIIDDGAFSNCSTLSSIDIPDNVTKIGTAAFRNCDSLLELDIPIKVAYIGASAFSSCENLVDINIPEGIVRIEDSTFNACTSLKEITIPESVTSIGDYAFCVCRSLENIIIPDNVTDIGAYAFNSCYNLANIVFSDSLTNIGENAFEFCALRTITIPDGVTNIDPGAFCWNTKLGAVTIPKSVVNIGKAAFLYCNSITDVFYKGDEELWNNIEIGIGNSSLTDNATIHYNYKSNSVTEIFNDIKEDEWFYNSIYYVYKNNIMTGLNANTFGPYETLSRAQFAVILHRMESEPGVEFVSRFPDVAPDQWYTGAVIWANSNGIITGYANTGLFGPADSINREQMAVMMYRYAKHLGIDTQKKADISTYKDAASVSSFAQEAMQWAVGNGIITGKSNGTELDPYGKASRAECAVIIERFIKS